MKVILLVDVPKVGKRLETKDVSSGFARNFLFPKKLAEIATEVKLSHLAKEKQRLLEEHTLHEELLLKTLDSLSKKTLHLFRKGNEKGHLFAGVGKADIQKILKDEHHVVLSEDAIELTAPIKTIGEYVLPITIGNHNRTLSLVIEQENE